MTPEQRVTMLGLADEKTLGDSCWGQCCLNDEQQAALGAALAEWRDTASPDELVREFHETYGAAIRDTPILVVPERRLRASLIKEEAQEYADAEAAGDLVEMADALADIVYVAYGAALVHGIPLDAVLREVHRSNMSKLGADGKPVLRPGDNKIMKGPNYSPPDIKKVLGLHHSPLTPSDG